MHQRNNRAARATEYNMKRQMGPPWRTPPVHLFRAFSRSATLLSTRPRFCFVFSVPHTPLLASIGSHKNLPISEEAKCVASTRNKGRRGGAHCNELPDVGKRGKSGQTGRRAGENGKKEIGCEGGCPFPLTQSDKSCPFVFARRPEA